MEERRMPQPIPTPASSRFDVAVAVNVTVSGTLVIELRTSSDAEKLKALTDSLSNPTTDLQTAIDKNPVPPAP